MRSLPHSLRAFTLIELLAAIAVVAVLGALLLPSLSRVRQVGDRTKCLSNLHQIGLGIQSYAADQGTLPGPLLGGQNAYYNTYALPTYLYPYLAAAGGQAKMGAFAPLFACPAWQRLQRGAPSTSAICYVVNNQIDVQGGPPWVYAFGYPSLTPPHTLAWVASLSGIKYAAYPNGPTAVFSSANTWMITDADQLNEAHSGAGWLSTLPATPVHGPVRNALFFDFHAESVPLDAFPQ